jgi:hypothetical protein
MDDIDELPFVVAGAGALALALLTVSYHALRAASVDPAGDIPSRLNMSFDAATDLVTF